MLGIDTRNSAGMNHDDVFSRFDFSGFGHIHDACESFSRIAGVQNNRFFSAHVIHRFADFFDWIIVGAEVVVLNQIEISGRNI